MSHFVIYRNQNGGEHKIRIFGDDEEKQAIAAYQASGSEGGAILVSAESLLALAQSEAHGRLIASLTKGGSQ